MGKGIRLVGVVAVCSVLVGCPSTPEPTDGGTLRDAAPCVTAADCDDGRFCNGDESCDATSADADERGCVPGALPCLESQRCSEAEARCVTACAIAPDADGDGADATMCGGTDCDDTDAMRFPGNAEVCDAANRDEDCDASTFGARDADGDAFVDAACCNDDGGTMRCGTDCNDSRRDAHPGATEACERLDNDCDGAVDEGLTVMAWPDRDFDLHGVTDDSMREEVCPGTPGYSLVSDDCDDASPTRHAAQLEICDSVDNDCDGMVDEAPVSVAWYPDEDGDLFGAPDPSRADGGVVISCAPVEGHSTRSSDCDDARAAAHPGAPELCNGLDDDCNGLADAGSTGPGDTEDDDGDRYADVVCGGNDCDDARADVHPGAPELCNMQDDDCDTVVDGGSAMAMWYLDLDRDGYGEEGSVPITSCEPQGGRVTRAGDCDDASAAVHPGAPDPCNAGTMPIDEDCDDSFDENGIRFAFFPDADGDGWGASAPAGIVFACTRPSGTSEAPGDCADTDALRHPTAPEQCQGLDDDCDAAIDEDSDQNWYLDADRDGHGTGAPIFQCMAPAGRVTLGDDCDDGDAGNFPGNTEACNGEDDDCDTMVDDGAGATCSGRPFSTGACVAGACRLTCDASHADCDGLFSTGCEADTARNSAYCGSCTTSCNPGDTCGETTLGVCDGARVVALDGSLNHVLGTRSTGSVVAWGSGEGYGATTSLVDATAPFATPLTDIVELASSEDGGCAVTSARRVLCWGRGDNYEMGNGSRANRAGPGEVPGLVDAIDVAVGREHVCVVHAGGTLSCWGANDFGQLGLGAVSTTETQSPTVVPGISDAVEVHAYHYGTCVRRGTAGAYYVTCWGTNTSGAVGIGSTTPANVAAPGANVIGLPPDVVGFSHGFAEGICVRTSDGRAFCWGGNGGNYSLGLGSASPVAVVSASVMAGMTNVVEIALSVNGGCLRRRGAAAGSGEVWCWGYHTSFSMPWVDGVTTTNDFAPRRAGTAATPIDDAVAIVAGTDRWCAARASGGVVCMGVDNGGSLGDGAPIAPVYSPTDVVGLP